MYVAITCLHCCVVFVGERKQSFQFTVHTESQWNSRNDWVMAAVNEKEMKEWIEAFKVMVCRTALPKYDIHTCIGMFTVAQLDMIKSL